LNRFAVLRSGRAGYAAETKAGSLGAQRSSSGAVTAQFLKISSLV